MLITEAIITIISLAFSCICSFYSEKAKQLKIRTYSKQQSCTKHALRLRGYGPYFLVKMSDLKNQLKDKKVGILVSSLVLNFCTVNNVCWFWSSCDDVVERWYLGHIIVVVHTWKGNTLIPIQKHSNFDFLSPQFSISIFFQ